jgi:hypothetical protein
MDPTKSLLSIMENSTNEEKVRMLSAILKEFPEKTKSIFEPPKMSLVPVGQELELFFQAKVTSKTITKELIEKLVYLPSGQRAFELSQLRIFGEDRTRIHGRLSAFRRRVREKNPDAVFP